MSAQRIFNEVPLNINGPARSMTPTQYGMAARAKSRHDKRTGISKLAAESVKRMTEKENDTVSQAM